MKYTITLFLFFLALSFFSCGPSEEEMKKNEEKKVEESKKLHVEFDKDIDAMLNDNASKDTVKK